MTRTTQERLLGLARSHQERKRPSWKLKDAQPGYGGQGLGEVVAIPREIVEAKGWRTEGGNEVRPDPGYDEAINRETVRRNPASVFYRYIYTRWNEKRDRKGNLKSPGATHRQIAADLLMYHLEVGSSGASGSAWDGIPPPSQFGSRTPSLSAMESNAWVATVISKLSNRDFDLIEATLIQNRTVAQVFELMRAGRISNVLIVDAATKKQIYAIAGDMIDQAFDALSAVTRCA